MRRPFFTLVLLLAVGTASVDAQTPATNTPARRPQGNPPVRSPEVQGGGRVTFRFRAARASEVVLAGQWPKGRTNMLRGTNDVWSVTTGPIEPGVWEYSFQVDGLSMIDPGNPATKPMREPRTSILHLPGQPPLVHDFQEVPHGVVRSHSYLSKSLGRLRELAVYTPPGYDHSARVRYPVLYLQHGSGDNQATWVTHGKAHWILDNLIAKGAAKPMIVVMMDGHAAVPGMGGAGPGDNTALFERDLLEDVMPFVDANYRTRRDSVGRAIAGLSMGGGQSLTIGLNHSDLFAWVAGFSSAAPTRETLAPALMHSPVTGRHLKLLWVGVGKDDFLLKRNEEFIALLKDNNLRHEWHLTEGGHSWPVWRLYLAELMPKLFK